MSGYGCRRQRTFSHGGGVSSELLPAGMTAAGRVAVDMEDGLNEENPVAEIHALVVTTPGKWVQAPANKPAALGGERGS